jgi:hypothetical protein
MLYRQSVSINVNHGFIVKYLCDINMLLRNLNVAAAVLICFYDISCFVLPFQLMIRFGGTFDYFIDVPSDE